MIHALTNKPHAVLIQLPRFRLQDRGLRKHRIPIDIPRTPIRIPEFLGPDTNTVQWSPFTIHSFVVHLGEERDVGHYRTCLISPKDEMVWLTDDGVQAQPLPLQDPVLQENCYVLYCTRYQASH